MTVKLTLKPFGNFAEFRNGLNFSASSYGEGVKFIGVSDFQDNFQPPYHDLKQVNPEGVVKESDYLQNGDIVFVRSNGNSSLVGRSLYIDDLMEPMVFSGFCIRARIHTPALNPLFCAYYVKSDVFRRILSSAAGGANIQNLNQGLLAKADIPVPDIKIQLKIVAILSAYDGLIENNLKRIKLLEEMAQITYDEWFVRLKFPGHATASMDSETGLPVGWEKTTLRNCCVLIMGQSPKSESYNYDKEGLPFHQGVKDYGFRFPENTCWSTDGSRIAKAKDILFSVRAPVGRLNIAIEDVILGRGLSAIRHNNGSQSFLFYQLKHIFFQEDMLGGGAIFASVTKEDMLRIELLKPDKRTESDFNEFAEAIDQNIENLHRQNQLLKEARDILLPRLMTGMIDVEQLVLPEPFSNTLSSPEQEPQAA